MTDSSLVVVHSFGSRPEADMAVSALEAAEIDAIVQADTGGGMRPHLRVGGRGVSGARPRRGPRGCARHPRSARQAVGMTVEGRVTDYDRIADRFDKRYSLYAYDGVRDALLDFLGAHTSAVLEVGCGTGHWLAVAANAPSERRILAGVDPSAPMLARAHAIAPPARLVRARAEDLPWGDATFDRIFCINALHHFKDRSRFFAEARRVLKPGGGLLTIGKDPHTDRDEWWVYDYFEETRAIDRERFARVSTLRGEMALAGFAWTESTEADHVEVVSPAGDALAGGVVDPGFTSQLSVLSDEEFQRGRDRLIVGERGGRRDTAAGRRLPALRDHRMGCLAREWFERRRFPGSSTSRRRAALSRTRGSSGRCWRSGSLSGRRLRTRLRSSSCRTLRCRPGRSSRRRAA